MGGSAEAAGIGAECGNRYISLKDKRYCFLGFAGYDADRLSRKGRVTESIMQHSWSN